MIVAKALFSLMLFIAICIDLVLLEKSIEMKDKRSHASYIVLSDLSGI